MVKIIKNSDHQEVKAAYAIHAASFHPKRADFLSFEGFKELCSLENASLLVVKQRQKTGGWLCFIPKPWQEAELLSLAVEKTHKKQGLGKKLIQKMITSLKKGGCQAIFLEVGEKNQAARALYRSFGARQVGSRKAYYTSPNGAKEDALLKKIPLR